MEEEDINKFLYGDEFQEEEAVPAKKGNNVKEEAATSNTSQNISENIEKDEEDLKAEEVGKRTNEEEEKEEEEEEEEDEFEIVIDGEDNKRGLTNISLAQPNSNTPNKPANPTANPIASISTLDLNGIGSIAGQSIFDVDLDDETGPAGERPWRKPGADITDYFNYGFNEVTWRMYCLRQRVLREEYGNAKNNNVPPALANNPLILQGLFPKGNTDLLLNFSNFFI